jgi:putative membrane protein
MLEASIQKDDKKAYILIGLFSLIVFSVVVFLSKYKFDFNPGFDVHIFAKIDAYTNML